MAETSKLDVGKALDKLRGNDTPLSRMTQLDSKIDELDEEMRRLKATSARMERDRRAAAAPPHAQAPTAVRPTRLGILAIAIGLVIVLLILTWKWLS